MEGSSDVDANVDDSNLNPPQHRPSAKHKKKKKKSSKKTKSIRSHASSSSYTTAENVTAVAAHSDIASLNEDASMSSKSHNAPASSSSQNESSVNLHSDHIDPNNSRLAVASADSLQKVEENIRKRSSKAARSAAARYSARRKATGESGQKNELNGSAAVGYSEEATSLKNVDTVNGILLASEEDGHSVSSPKASLTSDENIDENIMPNQNIQSHYSSLGQESGPLEGSNGVVASLHEDGEEAVGKDALERGINSDSYRCEEGENDEPAAIVINNGMVSSTGRQNESLPIVSDSGPQESAICAEVHPDVEFGMREVDQTAGIEAFVAEEAVEATGVAVVMSEEDEQRLEDKRINKYKLIGVGVFLILAIIVIIVVAVTVGGNGKVDEAPSKSSTPTTAPPSSSPTFAPSDIRMQEWADFLTSYSDVEALNNRTSPQYHALRFISDDDDLQLEVGSSQGLQRYLLACFYFALNGDNWDQCTRQHQSCGGDKEPWLLGEGDECNWFGIECDNSMVTSIFFRRVAGENLEGYLPPELGELSELERIILQNNDLKGTIPTVLGKLEKLKMVIFRGNQFEGGIPEELMKGAGNLGVIDFAGNQLTGTLPSNLSLLPIVTLDIAKNNFGGAIPAALGKLTDMTKLDLAENQLTGMIPEELYNAESLEHLHIFKNKLESTLSTNIGLLTNLETLRLGDNNIFGMLPDELYNITTLSDISFENARIEGALSADISAMHARLIKVDLSNNKMSGELPSESIEKLTLLTELLMHGNDFVGNVTEAICAERGNSLYELRNLTMPPTVYCTCCNLQA